MAASVEATKKSSTSGPPIRSSATLAPKPTDAKNAFCSGVCSVVSKPTSVSPRWCATLRIGGHQQAADDRRRDVVAAEQRDPPLDAVADEEHDTGQREGLNQIEREQSASCPCIVPGARANPIRKGPE